MDMNIRRLVGTPAKMLASLLPLPTMMRWTGQFLLLPLYHLVADTPPPHIRHLYPVRNRAQFRRDLEFLLSVASPITVVEFLEHVQEGAEFDRPVFLLSFDDGLRECHDVVTPILEEYGLEAICFLNSAFVGNNALFYRYTVSLLIEQLGSAAIPHEKAAMDFREITGLPPRNIPRQLMSLRYEDRRHLEQLAQRWNLDIPDWLAAQRPYLDQAQLQDMSSRGWTFGAHSMDHPMYSHVSLEEQIKQTRQSLKEIRHPGVNSRNLFAFPFTDYGVGRQFFNCMYEELEVAVSFGCAGINKDVFPRNFQRIPFEKSDWEAKDILRTEFLHYGLKGLIGRSTIRRDE